MLLNQYIKAIQDFDRVIELDPGDAAAYNKRGIAYVMLGKISQGCADLRKGCELGECGSLGWAKNKGVCQ